MAQFDVAVVGAGPAGSRAAFRLARHGVRVALVDGSHPREKPCGGGLTGRALAVVDDAIDLSALDAVSIDSAWFAHRGRRARVAMPHSDALPRLAVVSRRRFDEALVAAAKSAGAVLIPTRAAAVERRDGLWHIATAREVVRAGWLLGADGPTSLVRRSVHRPFDRAELSIASGYFVHGPSSTEIEVAFEEDPAGYLWSFPRREHLAVGVCGQADVATSRGLHEIARSWIAAHLADRPAQLERYSWPIPSLSASALDGAPLSGPEWLLLGDAAGLVDPITREGIYFALASAEAAADSLLTARAQAETYAARIRDTIHAELRRAAQLKDWFFRPQVSALLITALGRSGGIREVMADLVAGSQPYHGLRRRLLRTLEWKLMLELIAVAD